MSLDITLKLINFRITDVVNHPHISFPQTKDMPQAELLSIRPCTILHLGLIQKVSRIIYMPVLILVTKLKYKMIITYFILIRKNNLKKLNKY